MIIPIIICIAMITMAIVGAKRTQKLLDTKTAVHMYKGRLHIAQEQLKRRLEDMSQDKE